MSRIAHTLIAFVWQGALTAALLAAANLVLRRAATRYAAACAALAALFVFPAATALRSVPSEAEWIASAASAPEAVPASAGSGIVPLAPGVQRD